MHDEKKVIHIMNPLRLQIIKRLQTSEEPSIRYTTALFYDQADPSSLKMRELQEEIRDSPRAQLLLKNIVPKRVYSKWQGAFWVLSILAELNYPLNDDSLEPLLHQVYDWFFSPQFIKKIRTIKGKVRRCASQEGNAIYFSKKLGIADERTDRLVDRLLEFQWPDGGWNCDKNPEAHCSSYHESLIPLRALIKYLNDAGNKLTQSRKNEIQIAIEKAKEVFLKRELFLLRSTGNPIHWKGKESFTLLHFPYYWRYNILFALKVLNEGGSLGDPRCQNALSLIESKELPSGGFPAETKYYIYSSQNNRSGRSAVNWGGVRKRNFNEWVTSEIFSILKDANRL
ncbi:MAG: hypothetical protein ACFFE4_20230 [Candidatus Thorarchaeota archaeon]